MRHCTDQATEGPSALKCSKELERYVRLLRKVYADFTDHAFAAVESVAVLAVSFKIDVVADELHGAVAEGHVEAGGMARPKRIAWSPLHGQACLAWADGRCDRYAL